MQSAILLWVQDIGQSNFLANLMVYEYEALLFTQPGMFAQWTDDASVVTALRADVANAGAPEDINDSPQTTPSRRILAAMPGYQKTFHGPLIACDIGLDAMRQACPHFHAWLLAIEALPLIKTWHTKNQDGSSLGAFERAHSSAMLSLQKT